ncbi:MULTISPECIES: IclR family transcriptional regulator C-terminal domain-containing protein [unclassified Arthrobacter]|uniref:IclR family transcriptional regulator domain-containing protein n=1 Tax=unclassified Arthrobacter TaxID=235627 RepID=UPI00159DA585|nr:MULTISPECIES: IclR family transcriptional regulator C-terminal domain-containing protein [unclassified Arthrobacter]MCQ9166004.1 helix-turn-helix domain-containing protein [Arthrobacter sp. STN4]NVN00706.1 helix-turn-helix domain-containing protein [Arthrobacter sp. SDTb3-6]
MTEPQTTPPVASDQYVQSLARGLAVIRAFDADHPVMTLSGVAQRTALTRATSRRFLHTLVELGYVRTDGKNFSLTPAVLQLGYAYLSALSLPQLAEPHLQELSALLGESTSAAVLDDGDITYVARVSTRRIMSVGITVGTRFPAHATSMGRVLLAGMAPAALDGYFAHHHIAPMTPRTVSTEAELRRVLDQVRDQGWCLLDQELELGLMSMAAPVHDAAGKVAAAVNVSLQAQGVSAQADPAAFLARVRQELLRTAALISSDVAAGR